MKTTPLTILTAAAITAATFGSASTLQAQQASAGQALAKEAVLTSLTSKLDTKKTKVGDPVTVKTLNPVTLDDGSVLPTGSKITGKVTQVQPKSSGAATLAITFDQVEKKGGAPMPIHGLLAAIAPEPSMSSGSTNDLPMGSGGNKGQTAGMVGTGINGNTAAPQSIQPGSSIKGVTLSPGSDGSSVLQSTDKDFKLDSGTRLEIGLTAAQ